MIVETGTKTTAEWETLDLASLLASAADGLKPMYNSQRRMFCHRLKRLDGRLVMEGISERYTVMTLLGLHRLEVSGGQSPFRIDEVSSALLADFEWVDNLGDLGLLLWLCAELCPERFEQVYFSLQAGTALERFREGREGHTMDLSWFLSGLAHGAIALPEKRVELEELALRTYQALQRNQGPHGLFGHQNGGNITSFLRCRIGSFADQVYPIYAVSRFSQAYRSEEPLKMALACASAICKAQGGLGQWWWHYDSTRGKVIQRYPVYSVHQDGMAPMALLALTEASGQNFSAPIRKGLSWIIGENELGQDMRDPSSNLIWRSIYRTSSMLYAREYLESVTSSKSGKALGDLRVLHECRPYHLGWLLYALANPTTSDRE